MKRKRKQKFAYANLEDRRLLAALGSGLDLDGGAREMTTGDSIVLIDLLENASDPDANDTLEVARLHPKLQTGNTAGITTEGNFLVVDTSAYQYLEAGQSEVISFVYSVVDGNGAGVRQSITLTVTGIDDAPTVNRPVDAKATEDSPVVINLPGTASDLDANDTLPIMELRPPSENDVGVTINGAEGKNNAPEVTEAVNVTTTEDEPVIVDLLANASDSDENGELHIERLHPQLLSGNDVGVTINGTSLTFDPAAYQYLGVGEVEEISYSYSIFDNNGASVRQTANLTIVGLNDEPTVDGPLEYNFFV